MRKIIDLTMDIHEGMQTFAAHWHPFVEITQLGRHGIENRETRKITLGTHTGTHIDAPLHFINGGLTVDKIEIDILIGKASLINFSDLKDFQEIDLDLLKSRIKEKQTLERIVFRFDWDKKALGSNRYFSDHPFLSAESCEWLVEQGCRLIALDTPQPDNPKNGRNAAQDAPNHHILLGNKIYIVEYLVNLDQINKSEFELIVAPLKIKDGDGAPVRCFAIES